LSLFRLLFLSHSFFAEVTFGGLAVSEHPSCEKLGTKYYGQEFHVDQANDRSDH
jgi:hypothetical protein